MFALIVVLLAVLGHESLSLELKDFGVPAHVMKGESVQLNCSIGRGINDIYCIKWYKNNTLFYRYLPSKEPPAQVYNVPGIFLNTPGCCNEGNIFMHKTNAHSEGTYICEVFENGPDSKIHREASDMRIYVYPKSPPEVVAKQNHYAIGEIVNAICVSSASRPQAFLKFWINDQEASIEDWRRLQPRRSADGLFTSELILNFRAQPHHFRSGRMKLVCEALVPQGHTHRSQEVLVSYNSAAPAGSKYSVQNSQRDEPSISYEKGLYGVGDVVDINCTSGKSQPPAELHWYMNDREVKTKYVKILEPIIHKDGMISTISRLRFTVQDWYFKKNKMHLRCTATIFEVKKMSSEALEIKISKQHTSDRHMDATEADRK